MPKVVQVDEEVAQVDAQVAIDMPAVRHGELADELSKSNDNEEKQVKHEQQEQTEQEKHEEKKPAKAVSLCKLYRYATTCDLLLLWLGIFWAAVSGALMPCMALLIGMMIHMFSSKESAQETVDGAETLAVAFCVLGVLMGLGYYSLSAAFRIPAANQYGKIKALYLEAVLRQDITWLDETTPGKLQSRLAADTLLILEAMGEKLGNAIQGLFQFVSGFVIAFYVSWKLALVMLAIIPALALTMGIFMAVINSITKKQSESAAGASSISQEAMSAVRTVSSLTAQVAMMGKYDEESADKLKAGKKMVKSINISISLFMGLITASYSLALWYGGRLVSQGEINGGQVVTVFWAILMGGLAVGQMTSPLGTILQGKQAAHAIFEVIDRVPPIDSSAAGGLTPERCRGEIELRNVVFHYPSRPDMPIFKDYSLHVRSGETVALVGESGGGKSTVISLIERFYDPVAGAVLLDGVDLKDLNVQWLRGQMGLVAQEPVLFACSILENIGYGKVGASEAEVHAAARMANAHDFVSAFPSGYGTEVGERGVQLSGGQKQRVAIARAIIKDPTILLLDEATSALDSESERVVQAALDQLLRMKRRTTVVVAHRLSTVKDADLIAVIYDGKIVEQGKHAELARVREGRYANLLALQDMSDSGYTQGRGHGGGAGRLKLSEAGPRSTESAKNAVQSDDTDGESDPDAIDDNTDKDIFNVNLQSISKVQLQKMNKQGLSQMDKRRLWEMNAPETGYLALGFVGSLVCGALQPFQAVLFAEVINIFYVRAKQDMEDDVNTKALWFLILAFGIFITNLTGWATGYAGIELTQRLSKLFFLRVMHQDIAFHDSLSPGTLNAQLTHDSQLITQGQGQAVSTYFRTVGTVGGMLTIAMYFSWRMALVALAVCPLIVIGGLFTQTLFSRAPQDEANRLEAQLVAEAVGSVRTIAALAIQPEISRLYARGLRLPVANEKKRAHAAGAGNGFSQFVNSAANALLFFAHAKWFSEGLVTFEEGFIVIMCVMMCAPSIGQYFAYLPDRIKADIAAARMFRVIDRVPPIDSSAAGGLTPERCRGEIELRNVVFHYPSRPDMPIFKDYSLHVRSGETVALVGESGGGKSTVISLIERFYDPVAGAVLLDGVDLKDLNVQWLRGQMGLVAQEPVLFACSILENIGYGKVGASEAEVHAAARMANAHDFVSAFPSGYGTEVGERGVQLSGGQKQRVAIARAIIKDPTILLLDEATSALDSESERVVQAALDQLLRMKRRTTVVVAHRLSTVKDADLIAVIYDGKIVEQGKHHELASVDGGHYHRLLRRQLQEDEPAPGNPTVSV